MTTQEVHFVDPSEKELERLLQQSAATIVRCENAENFLDWFHTHAVEIAPHVFKPYAAQELPGFVAAFARHIWDHTPLPGNRYLPRPLPAAECDGAQADHPEVALLFLSMLPYVLEALPAQQLETLPYEELSVSGLSFVAETWMEQGREPEVVRLLQGLFAQIDRLDERAEHCFDCLLVCYDRLQQPQQKKDMIETGMRAANTQLRAAAIQRQCCILIDGGEHDRAWDLFGSLRNLPHDAAELAHLEVSMLIGQGEHSRAMERAKFWLTNLNLNRSEEKITLLEFFSAVAAGESQHGDKAAAK